MSEIIMETSKLTKTFETLIAVNGVNLRIPKGSIYALLGPNGAGKTTTIRMLLGILKPNIGQIMINGTDVIAHPRSIRGKIGILPQISAAYHDLTPLENIRFIMNLHNISFSKNKHKLDDYFDTLGLTNDLLNKPFSKLSGGEQRAVCFIMASILNTEILILDEPTSGLDIARAKYIRSIISQMAEEGKTILLSSHIVSDLEELATHCGIMKKGQLVFQGTKHELIDFYSPESRDFEEAIIAAFDTSVSPLNQKEMIA